MVDSSLTMHRINGTMMPNYQGQNVALLGTAHDPNNDGMSFSLRTCDGQEVTVRLQEPLTDYMQGIVEVHGKVQGTTILASNYVVFDPDQTQDFDMAQYNKAIEFSQRFPQCYKTV